MLASEFIDCIDSPVVFIVGVGCPAGIEIAILPETELPFQLESLEGNLRGAIFHAENFSCRDFKGNDIYKIQIYNNEVVWEEQYSEFIG